MGAAQVIKPQPRQARFLSTSADVALYGGAAGGGKSWAEILDPVRFVHVPGFAAVVFRRRYVDFFGEGGLWTESEKLYPHTGGTATESRLEWDWPSGAQVRFFHLQKERDKYAHQGKQYAAIYFDELTHFTRSQFFYLLSRNRSTCGVRPYVRATCNADADSWVADLVEWWIGDDGLPIEERAGVLRWFVVDPNDGDRLVWGDSPEEVAEKAPHVIGDDDPHEIAKSFTFIPARLEDNPALVERDPGYRGRLRLQGRVERARLEDGNWHVRANAGTVFRRDDWRIVDRPPCRVVRSVRAWDLAATEDGGDYATGLKLGRLESGEWIVLDVVRFRRDPAAVERMVRATAEVDGPGVTVLIEQEPGSAGKITLSHFARNVVPAGHVVRVYKPATSKTQRADPVSGQAALGHFYVLRAAWNDAFLDETEGFPEADHDDQVDALTSGFAYLVQHEERRDVAVPDIGTGGSSTWRDV